MSTVIDERLDAMFAAIKAKEIERPGVAGPFWSPLYFEFDYLLSSGQTTLDESLTGKVARSRPSAMRACSGV